jgi:hypothetical protein
MEYWNNGILEKAQKTGNGKTSKRKLVWIPSFHYSIL